MRVPGGINVKLSPDIPVDITEDIAVEVASVSKEYGINSGIVEIFPGIDVQLQYMKEQKLRIMLCIKNGQMFIDPNVKVLCNYRNGNSGGEVERRINLALSETQQCYLT